MKIYSPAGKFAEGAKIVSLITIIVSGLVLLLGISIYTSTVAFFDEFQRCLTFLHVLTEQLIYSINKRLASAVISLEPGRREEVMPCVGLFYSCS